MSNMKTGKLPCYFMTEAFMFSFDLTEDIRIPPYRKFCPSSSFWPLPTSKYKQFIKGCLLQNGTEAFTLGRNLNSFLGSVHFTGESERTNHEATAPHQANAQLIRVVLYVYFYNLLFKTKA